MMDRWITSGLALLVDGSIRWGIVVAALAVWFALRPPRRAATRHALCVAALAAGAALPFTPRWGVVVPWPHPSRSAPEPAASPSPIALPAATAAQARSARTIETPRPLASENSGPVRAVSIPPPRPAAPINGWRLAALAASGVWVIVASALLARLACGCLALARMKRGVLEPGEEADRLMDECRARLGMRRRARLAMHPGAASPVVLGGLRPMVVVPPDWNDWPEPHRRACLLHELAHLARYDDWSKFAEELIRVPYFFHPLALWLFARLDRERELLCDEAVVAQGADPSSLARLLLDLAKRPARLVSVPRPGLLPFLDRRTVLVRIERLLEDDMPRTLSRSSLGRSLVLGSVALAVALGVGGLGAFGFARPQKGNAKPRAKAARAAAPQGVMTKSHMWRPDDPRIIRCLIVDSDGKPVPNASIATSFLDPASYGGGLARSDDEGRDTYYPSPPDRGDEDILFLAWKQGAGAGVAAYRKGGSHSLELRLAELKPLEAVILDEQAKPIAGAKVRVTALRLSGGEGEGVKAAVHYLRVPPYLLDTRLPQIHVDQEQPDRLLIATTADDGSVSLPRFAGETGRKLEVVAPDGRVLLVKGDEGFVLDSRLKAPRLTAVPSARVSGRVVTTMPGVSVGRLGAVYQGRVEPSPARPPSNEGAHTTTRSDGGFVFEGLEPGKIDILLPGSGRGADWSCRPAEGVELTLGKTSEVTIELIPGVEFQGTVVAHGTGAPVEGVEVAADGPVRTRSAMMRSSVKTDADGRYWLRTPAGPAHLFVLSTPAGYSTLPGAGSERSVTIPEGAKDFEVPPIEIAAAATVHGKLIDATGAPIAGAKMVGVFDRGNPRPFENQETATDADGGFRLPPDSFDMIKIGERARLMIHLDQEGGAEYEAGVIPKKDGAVVVQLPIVQKPPGGVEGPRDVPPDELAALVVDPDGKPIEGAEVDLMAFSSSWREVITKTAKTDAQGVFRISGLDKIARHGPQGPIGKVEVKVSKPGATPQKFMEHPVGKSGWVVVLGNQTYFEGRVTAPDGKPIAGALVRANSGPKRGGVGYVTPGVWTEAKTDDDGRYRMHAQPDVYDIEVRVPNVGQASLPQTSIDPDEQITLDIALTPGADFRAKVVDSVTGDPVQGVRLWHYQYPDVVGRSDEKGELTITAMRPGRFQFNVDAPGRARWWSEQSADKYGRRFAEERFGGWQRNTGYLDFELQPGMATATIVVERAVTLSGKVVDPDGKPFAGATVALHLIYDDPPASSSSGYTFDHGEVESDREGRFQMTVPASNEKEYNLLAHDGAKPREWRTWSNGVLPSFRTKPGDVIEGLEIHLTRPATFRGRIVNPLGVGRQGARVYVSAVDRLDDHQYDRAVQSGPGGVYEVNFLRPGAQLIRIDPFGSDENGPIEPPSRIETLTPGEVMENVDVLIPARGRRKVGPQAAR